MVKYDELASVIRHCECGKTSATSTPNTFNSSSTHSRGKKYNSVNSNNNTNGRNGNKSNCNYKYTSIQDAIAAKRVSKCRKCRMYGHWASDHLPNGNIRYGLPTSPTSIPGNNNNNNGGHNRNNNNR